MIGLWEQVGQLLRTQGLTAGLLGSLDLVLLVWVMPARALQNVKRAPLWEWAGCWLLLTAAHCLEDIRGLYGYIALLAVCLSQWVCLWTLGRMSAGAAGYSALCYFLLSNCVDGVLRFGSMRLLGTDLLRIGPMPQRAAALLLQGAVLGGLLLLLRRKLPQDRQMNRSVLWAAVLSSVPYLFVCRITNWLPLDNEQLTGAIPVMLAASCALALTMQITVAGRLQAEIQARRLEQSLRMDQQRRQQFLLAKASADALQRNYHDLKNILLYLEQAADKEEVRAYTRRVIGEVRPFEQLVRTGNEAMDILLGQKLAVCQAEEIPCTVNLEGALFNFVDPLDLCTILGNGLDNAIEASRKLEPERRRILIKSARRGEYALLSVRNNCLPGAGNWRHSSKPNPDQHGYGIANIRRTAQTYGGEAVCSCSEGSFLLTVLLLRPKGETGEE